MHDRNLFSNIDIFAVKPDSADVVNVVSIVNNGHNWPRRVTTGSRDPQLLHLASAAETVTLEWSHQTMPPKLGVAALRYSTPGWSFLQTVAVSGVEQ